MYFWKLYRRFSTNLTDLADYEQTLLHNREDFSDAEVDSIFTTSIYFILNF